jgi:predicted TIM-barrel fold metal-dependent hydrolase
MQDTPQIISVDDHVTEPPDVWLNRLPKAVVQERGPKIVRKKLQFVGGTKGREWIETEDGDPCDAWVYDDATLPISWLTNAIGQESIDFEVTTFDEIRPGCWRQKERLEDMASNHVSAAMCFPNQFRFAGQTFSERADKEYGLQCIRAYNDWMIEEWCGGDGKGILLPVTVVPLWDANLAAEEIRRCANKGSYLVSFPENPWPLGFPSLYTKERFWDPFFQACEETNTIVNMHIGSSSRMTQTSDDAPFIVSSTLTFANSQMSLLDYIFSGTLERFQSLKLSYSEGQVGWQPFVVERADKLWGERDDNEFGSGLKKPPSEYIRERVFYCIFDDDTGLRNRDYIGMSQILFETDYPHADSTFPHTKETFERITTKAGMTEQEAYALARGNAIRGFNLERYGITA